MRSDHRRRPAADGAPETTAEEPGGDGKGTAHVRHDEDPRLHGTVTAAEVAAAVRAADLRQLARALDPGAFQGDHGPQGFTCPACGLWTAEVLDEWRWACSNSSCRHGVTLDAQGTRWSLRAAVLESAAACWRLVGLLGTREVA